MSEEEKKPEQSEEPVRKMSAVQFWVRFALWVLISVVAPIVYIGIRYGIFTHSGGESTSLTGWGILALIVIAAFMLRLISEAKKGLPYGSMLCQCIDGYRLLIPIVLLIFLLETVKDNIDAFEEVLIMFTVCEAVAIPINPMRRWAYENNIERESSILVKIITKAINKSDKK